MFHGVVPAIPTPTCPPEKELLATVTLPADEHCDPSAMAAPVSPNVLPVTVTDVGLVEQLAVDPVVPPESSIADIPPAKVDDETFTVEPASATMALE